MFKSAEEREAERQAREAEEARVAQARAEQARAAEEARQRAAFLSTPVGAATLAKQEGQRFLEIQVEVGQHSGQAFFGTIDSKRTVSSSATMLGDIEALGWHLEHANYFFMITGESSTQKVFLTGDNTAINGVTVGAYLFRNTDPVRSPTA